jgi:hypothetical protein
VARFVVTGNEVTLVFNNVVVDLFQTFRATDDYGFEPASGIGDIHCREYVPTLARHAISISRLVLTKENAMKLNIIQENGDSALKSIVFDIQLFSKVTGQLMRKYIDGINNSGDIGVTAHRIIINDANFVAIDATGTLNIAA